MVEDRVDNLQSKNSVEIKGDRSPWGEDKIMVFIYRQPTYFRGVPVFEPQVISDFSCIDHGVIGVTSFGISLI